MLVRQSLVLDEVLFPDYKMITTCCLILFGEFGIWFKQRMRAQKFSKISVGYFGEALFVICFQKRFDLNLKIRPLR